MFKMCVIYSPYELSGYNLSSDFDGSLCHYKLKKKVRRARHCVKFKHQECKIKIFIFFIFQILHIARKFQNSTHTHKCFHK